MLLSPCSGLQLSLLALQTALEPVTRLETMRHSWHHSPRALPREPFNCVLHDFNPLPVEHKGGNATEAVCP
jgi:hypothetical protein